MPLFARGLPRPLPTCPPASCCPFRLCSLTRPSPCEKHQPGVYMSWFGGGLYTGNCGCGMGIGIAIIWFWLGGEGSPAFLVACRILLFHFSHVPGIWSMWYLRASFDFST